MVYLTRTKDYKIYELDWLKLIMSTVQIFPSRLASRPVTFFGEKVVN